MSAPSGAKVLKQSGSATYPWCVKNEVAMPDGVVEVKFKPIAGKEDQAGGVVWRWKDSNNYYVARANALEGNVSLYYTLNGRSEEHTSELQSLMRISYAVFCLKKKTKNTVYELDII